MLTFFIGYKYYIILMLQRYAQSERVYVINTLSLLHILKYHKVGSLKPYIIFQV